MSHITTTQRYCHVANLKVQRDYYKAMETGPSADQGNEKIASGPGNGEKNSPLRLSR